MKAGKFLTPEFWPQAEKLCYYVLLPALFVNGTANTKFSELPIGTMAPVLAGSVILTAIALVLAQRRLGFDGPAFTSVVQGSIRFNNYLGLAIAVALYGEQGMALAAIANTILVPVANVLCTIAFARYGNKPLSIKGTLRSVGTNPLILGCAAGILLNLSGLGLPAGAADFVRALGSASLPLGLLCVGAALKVRSMGRDLRPVAFASATKFLVLPGIATAGCMLFGLAGPPAGIVILFLALPTASSAYVMAQALGGDSSLMASTIAMQTLAGVLYLPGLLFLITGFAG